MNNYTMCAHNFIKFIYLSILYCLPFCTSSYIVKVSIHSMRNFNRLAWNKYEARSVEVMVSQYFMARSEKKSKDTSSSWTLFSDVRS